MTRPGLFVSSHQGIRANVESANQVGTRWGLSGDQIVVLRACVTEKSISELIDVVGGASRTRFRNSVLKPLMQTGLTEMTIPEKPRSSNQKYRITDTGRALLTGREMP